MYQRLTFLILIVFFPLHLSLAIPPPDLIISTSQAVLTTIGLIVGAIIILWKQITDYSTTLGKKQILLYVSLSFIILSLVYISSNFTTIQMIYWRHNVDTELGELWQKYEPVYSAQNENIARNKLLSAQHEITWTGFETVATGREYLVVDIREDYAFEAGRVPNSIHMRFGDLINGRWETLLPYKDTPIFVVCYLGVTGTLAIDFLEKRGFTELYRPVEGIFYAKRTEPDFPLDGKLATLSTKAVTKSAMEEAVKEGVDIIDLRSPDHYSQSLPFVINYRNFRQFRTSENNKHFLDSLPKDEEYILICDSSISCYQADVMTLDLVTNNMRVRGVYDITQ